MDDADITQIRLDKEEAERDAALLSGEKYEIPAGVPGDCDLCGEWFGRLIKGACVSCRMKYGLD